MSSSDALRERLLATFKMEAREHVATLSSALLDLEASEAAPTAKLIETAFRVAHSLKGAARSVNLGQIESVCQAMESVFSGLKRGNLAFSREHADVLLHAVRVLEQLLDAAERGRTGAVPAVAPLLTRLRNAATPPPTPTAPSPAPPTPTAPSPSAAPSPAFAATSPAPAAPSPAQPTAPAAPPTPPTARPTPSVPPSRSSEPAPASARPKSVPAPDSGEVRGERTDDLVRVPARKLDRTWLLAEELLAEKSAAVHHARELVELRDKVTVFRRSFLRAARDLRQRPAMAHAHAGNGSSAPARALDTALDSLFDRTQYFLEEIEHATVALGRSAEHVQRGLSAKVDALLTESRDLLMLPCAWLLSGLRHVVRDLAQDQGKNIALVLEGESIELDRRILTDLKDPVLHMLRNSVDHGIESASERAQARKPARATITIAIAQLSGNRVRMTVTDDGRGIALEKVKASALRLGLLDAERAERLEAEELRNLVFASEVSTSPMITDLSGRGLGLAIVREKVERLGGRVGIVSPPDGGTCIEMILPLSLATFRGVVVRAGGRFFVVPTLNVARVLRVRRDSVQSIENRAVIEHLGRSIPLAPLVRALGLLELETHESDSTWLSIVVLAAGGTPIAFVVDEVCHEQDVLVKPLGHELDNLRGVIGATVLVSGKIAPILDVGELIRRALQLEGVALLRSQPRAAESQRKRSILVAEDSITSRTLLKGILEGAGFSVVTAVDGADAFAKLKTGSFDLVVSDVDMPRLNGLGLTQKIRADKALSEIPVVLVTSLESREDRERGVDVGASAYIVKRSFEQSNLLDTIQRLL